MFSLKSLHHGMDGDEGTSTTHAITGGGGGGDQELVNVH